MKLCELIGKESFIYDRIIIYNINVLSVEILNVHPPVD